MKLRRTTKAMIVRGLRFAFYNFIMLKYNKIILAYISESMEEYPMFRVLMWALMILASLPYCESGLMFLYCISYLSEHPSWEEPLQDSPQLIRPFYVSILPLVIISYCFDGISKPTEKQKITEQVNQAMYARDFYLNSSSGTRFDKH